MTTLRVLSLSELTLFPAAAAPNGIIPVSAANLASSLPPPPPPPPPTQPWFSVSPEDLFEPESFLFRAATTITDLRAPTDSLQLCKGPIGSWS